MIFQDPYSSLNPRMTVRQVLTEALSVHRDAAEGARSRRASPSCSTLVRLPADAAERYPHEFSGGQRQRIGIARALAVEPECWSPTSSSRRSTSRCRRRSINLLLQLQERLQLTVVFVAHDLRLVRHISHRVAVMYLGKVVEISPTEALFAAPRHPYSKALLGGCPGTRPDAADAGCGSPRRAAQPARPAGRLPVQHALPARVRPLLCRAPAIVDAADPAHLAACHLAEFGMPAAETIAAQSTA